MKPKIPGFGPPWRTCIVHKDTAQRIHLARGINHPLWGKMYTAVCDVNLKGWYVRVGDKVSVREIPALVECLRCIRIAGYEEARQKYEIVHSERRNRSRKHMVPINIDFEGVSDSGLEPVDDGDYPARITSIKAGLARESQKPKVEFEFTGTDAAGAAKGRKFWRNYSLQPNALWALKRDLTSLGVEVPDGAFELDEAEMMGTECLLRVKKVPHWRDADKWTNEVSEVLPAGESMGW